MRLATDRKAAERYSDLWLTDNLTEDDKEEYGRIEFGLERDLRSRITTGVVSAAGFLPGSLAISHPALEWWQDAEFDYRTNSATAHKATLLGVRISPGTALQTKPAERVRSNSYRQSDLLLIEEMARLIRAGQAGGPWDAAMAVAGKASGKGTIQSKAKRVLRLFSESNIQSVQN